MVKNQIIVESVVSQGLGVRATAAKYGVSPAWVSTLVSRYRTEGPSAFEGRSKRPHANSKATPPEIEDHIIELRKELLEIGTDAGADTIHTHLEREGLVTPSISTIQRILTRRGFVTPAPKKRPKSSYVRFAAELPNECWQSDMTHWHLEDGTGVEILTFLDDHSRFVLSVRAYPTTTMENVRRLFAQSRERHGTPASVLTDMARSTTPDRAADAAALRATSRPPASFTNTRAPTTHKPAARSVIMLIAQRRPDLTQVKV